MDGPTTDWKTAALAMMPDLAEEVARADTPYLLWIDLYEAFRAAYEPPVDHALIGRVYRYAKWCLDQPRGDRFEDDINTCACLCFYQNIPLLPRARDELGRWLTPEDFSTLRMVLRFHSDDAAFERIAAQFRPESPGG